MRPADSRDGSFSALSSAEEGSSSSLAEERNLFNLRAMFAHKARQTMKMSSSVLEATKHPSGGAHSEEPPPTDVQGKEHSGGAPAAEGASSMEEGGEVFSLSAEYAATVLQRRWREGRRRREARARLKVKRAQSALATVEA